MGGADCTADKEDDMNHRPRATVSRTAARLAGFLGAAMLLLGAVAAPAPTAAETTTPVIWAEMHEMRPPCKEVCFRDLKPPGIVIVGTGFGPYATVQLRFVSLDGSRESFIAKTEAYSEAGDVTLRTGERVCNGWLGSPLEPTGLPDEHAWEVRAEVLTTKPGVPVIASNILYLYSCGDGAVG